ncbi:MAG TPA: methyltransferase domain-containing protein [Candidatus Krumholzibacteria bacterium]|nr:methyltransferase domain-containing protein [Candidatus Krumholzibacteria bacterium]
MGADEHTRPAFSFDAVIFEPSIRHLIAAARPHPGESVLDVACGSGIAACKAGMMVGAHGRVCGVDIGPNILKKAATLYIGDAPAAWVRADMAALPFADGAFRLVLCHQGLQFAADREAVVRELRRVTARGGRAVVMCWSHIADCPFYLALRDVLNRHLGAAAAGFVAAPFSLPEEQDLHDLLGAAFPRVSMSRISVRTAHPSAGAFAEGFLRYLPPSLAPREACEAARDAIVEEMDRRLEPWQVDGPMIAPIVTHLAIAG